MASKRLFLLVLFILLLASGPFWFVIYGEHEQQVLERSAEEGRGHKTELPEN